MSLGRKQHLDIPGRQAQIPGNPHGLRRWRGDPGRPRGRRRRDATGIVVSQRDFGSCLWSLVGIGSWSWLAVCIGVILSELVGTTSSRSIAIWIQRPLSSLFLLPWRIPPCLLGLLKIHDDGRGGLTMLAGIVVGSSKEGEKSRQEDRSWTKG